MLSIQPVSIRKLISGSSISALTNLSAAQGITASGSTERAVT